MVCSDAAAADKCSVCDDGYWLDSSASCSTACGVSNCKACSGEDAADKCTECDANFFLSTNKESCTAFIANCKVHRDDSGLKCSTCNDGYWLDDAETSCSIACTAANCKSCSAASAVDKCSICNDGYTKATDNTCVEMTSNCVTMASENVCEACEPKYYVNDNNECS